MRAVQYRTIGETPKVVDIEKPSPGPGQVTVVSLTDAVPRDQGRAGPARTGQHRRRDWGGGPRPWRGPYPGRNHLHRDHRRRYQRAEARSRRARGRESCAAIGQSDG